MRAHFHLNTAKMNEFEKFNELPGRPYIHIASELTPPKNWTNVLGSWQLLLFFFFRTWNPWHVFTPLVWITSFSAISSRSLFSWHWLQAPRGVTVSIQVFSLNCLSELLKRNLYRPLVFNRNLKIRGRRWQRKGRWKSEFAFFQSSSRLLQVTNFVKWRWTLLKLNS